jgi:hypothetical protein
MPAPPSLEIACIGLAEPAPLEAHGFAIVCAPSLTSQCVPSRFQPHFDRASGCLYRLGAAAARGPRPSGALSAYGLLSVECRERFPPSLLQFAPEHVAQVAAVIASIVSASPRGEALFTSDWEFGPEWAHRFGPVTPHDFWRLHESRALYLNTAYTLSSSA